MSFHPFHCCVVLMPSCSQHNVLLTLVQHLLCKHSLFQLNLQATLLQSSDRVVIYSGCLGCRLARLNCFQSVHTALTYVWRPTCDMSTAACSVSWQTTRTRSVDQRSSQFTRAKVQLASLPTLGHLQEFLLTECLLSGSVLMKFCCIVFHQSFQWYQEEAVMLMAIYILCLYYAGLVNSVCLCAVYCCVADLQWLIASMPAIADFPLVPMHISEE